MDRQPVADRVMEVARQLAEDRVRAATKSAPSPVDRIAAWAMLDMLEEARERELRDEIVRELSRAVEHAVELSVLGEDGEQITHEEAVKRIATSFIHAQNALRDAHLPGLFLWDTTEAKQISDAVGADHRGGGLGALDGGE